MFPIVNVSCFLINRFSFANYKVVVIELWLISLLPSYTWYHEIRSPKVNKEMGSICVLPDTPPLMNMHVNLAPDTTPSASRSHIAKNLNLVLCISAVFLELFFALQAHFISLLIFMFSSLSFLHQS